MQGAAPSAADLSAIGAGEFAALMAPLGPFGHAPHILAGVSGGPHSLALVLLLRDWAAARGGTCIPAIIEHGLRPDSAAEADGVARMLAGQGLAPRIVPLGLAGGSAVQHRAREARMAALLSLACEMGASWVALGHHQGDQAETLVLRALAGSGPSGLASMAPARATAAALILRPLLGQAPARLEAVVAAHGLVPVRDPSNHDWRFSRVRLRCVVEDAAPALAHAARAFAIRRIQGEAAQAARLAACTTLHPEGFARIDLTALGQDSVAGAALATLVRLLGAGRYPPNACAIRALLARGQGTLGGVQLARDGVLAREVASLAAPVPAEAGRLWDGRWRVESAIPGGEIGALGADVPRIALPRWMPARVACGLPALRRNGMLVAVPSLGYGCVGIRLRFAPPYR